MKKNILRQQVTQGENRTISLSICNKRDNWEIFCTFTAFWITPQHIHTKPVIHTLRIPGSLRTYETDVNTKAGHINQVLKRYAFSLTVNFIVCRR